MVSDAVVRVAILLELFFVALTVVISAVGVRLGVGPDGGRRAGLQFESRVLLLLLVELLMLRVHLRGVGAGLETMGCCMCTCAAWA